MFFICLTYNIKTFQPRIASFFQCGKEKQIQKASSPKFILCDFAEHEILWYFRNKRLDKI